MTRNESFLIQRDKAVPAIVLFIRNANRANINPPVLFAPVFCAEEQDKVS